MIDTEITLAEINELSYNTFHQLYNSYYQALVGYAKTFIDDTEACEDLVQEIFLTLWDKKSKRPR